MRILKTSCPAITLIKLVFAVCFDIVKTRDLTLFGCVLHFCPRFRVVDETFVDTTPTGPKTDSDKSQELLETTKKSPYTLIVIS